jgi:hypothetical protein
MYQQAPQTASHGQWQQQATIFTSGLPRAASHGSAQAQQQTAILWTDCLTDNLCNDDYVPSGLPSGLPCGSLKRWAASGYPAGSCSTQVGSGAAAGYVPAGCLEPYHGSLASGLCILADCLADRSAQPALGLVPTTPDSSHGSNAATGFSASKPILGLPLCGFSSNTLGYVPMTAVVPPLTRVSSSAATTDYVPTSYHWVSHGWRQLDELCMTDYSGLPPHGSLKHSNRLCTNGLPAGLPLCGSAAQQTG